MVLGACSERSPMFSLHTTRGIVWIGVIYSASMGRPSTSSCFKDIYIMMSFDLHGDVGLYLHRRALQTCGLISNKFSENSTLPRALVRLFACSLQGCFACFRSPNNCCAYCPFLSQATYLSIHCTRAASHKAVAECSSTTLCQHLLTIQAHLCSVRRMHPSWSGSLR